MSSQLGHECEGGGNSCYIEKLAVSIALSHKAIEAWELCKANGRLEEFSNKVNDAVQILLDHLLDTYDGQVPSSDFKLIFSKNMKEHLLELDVLTNLAQGSIPLAIMRAVSAQHRVIFDENAVPGWRRYTMRYISLLLGKQSS